MRLSIVVPSEACGDKDEILRSKDTAKGDIWRRYMHVEICTVDTPLELTYHTCKSGRGCSVYKGFVAWVPLYSNGALTTAGES